MKNALNLYAITVLFDYQNATAQFGFDPDPEFDELFIVVVGMINFLNADPK